MLLRAFLVIVVCLVGCKISQSYPLLDLEKIGPATIESGDALTVVGSGFPLGRSGVMILSGEARQPGKAKRDVKLSLPVSVRSESELRALPTDAFFSELGGRTTWAGICTIVFETENGGTVFGELRATVDFVPATVDHLADRSTALSRSALAVEEFGVVLQDTESDGNGLSVISVRTSSPAASAGLVTGDRVIELDGVRLLGASDFIPAAGVHRSLVKVQTQHSSVPLLVGLAFPNQRAGSWVQLLLLFVFGLAVGWYSPLSGWAVRSARSSFFANPLVPLAARRRRWLPHAATVVVASALACLLIRQIIPSQVGVVLLFLALATIPLAIDAWKNPSGQRRLGWAWLSVLWLCAGAGWFGGTDLIATSDAQSFEPHGWHAMSSVTAFALSIACVSACGRVTKRVIPYACAWVWRFVGLSLCTAIFFGGWASAFGAPLGVLIYGIKVLTLDLLARMLTPHAEALSKLAVVGLMVGVSMRYLGVHEFIEAASPMLLSGMLFAIAAYALFVRFKKSRSWAFNALDGAMN